MGTKSTSSMKWHFTRDWDPPPFSGVVVGPSWAHNHPSKTRSKAALIYEKVVIFERPMKTEPFEENRNLFLLLLFFWSIKNGFFFTSSFWLSTCVGGFENLSSTWSSAVMITTFISVVSVFTGFGAEEIILEKYYIGFHCLKELKESWNADFLKNNSGNYEFAGCEDF